MPSYIVNHKCWSKGKLISCCFLSGSVSSRFGALRLNGLYRAPAALSVATTQRTCQAVVPYQVLPLLWFCVIVGVINWEMISLKQKRKRSGIWGEITANFDVSEFSHQAKHFSVSPVTKGAPEIEQAGHDHVLHWTAERILSVILMGAIPVAAVWPTPSAEYFLALTMTVHSHW